MLDLNRSLTFIIGRRSMLALGALALAFAVLVAACGAPATRSGEPSSTTGVPFPTAEMPSAVGPGRVVSLAATGDIIMGNAPNRLPADGGKGFFDAVERALRADLVMGNLEEPLTVDTGTGKCAAHSTRCFQFRAPPQYAAHLRDAGFDLLNQANNHGYDYGPKGYANTRKALEAYDLAHTGAPDQITVVEVNSVKIAVAGFSPYAWSNSLIDIAKAKRVVAKAATMADLVVVQVHMGGEGADKTRVRPGTEMFLGENRGDPVRFPKAMIDAGADLIVGHGPHVLRGMEFYKGRLIAYSLGNFAGGGKSLSNDGRFGWGGVLKVSLRADGTWAGGSLTSTYLDGAGRPSMDPDDRGLRLVRQLSGSDFPQTGARFGGSGRITPPTGD
ncbi:CapA family protein [Micromonospora sp. NPDC004551]|uniref:CapA family protein n=1 Tax=Micromonospora sp. NPDC004551 TaxID=3154284 RepID=UPI0033BAA7F4